MVKDLLQLRTFLLILFGYILYFILLIPLSVNDEPAHIQIVVSIAKGSYARIWQPGEYAKNLTAVDKIDTSLKYVDHPDQNPDFTKLTTLKEEKGDYDMNHVFSHEAFGSLFYYVIGAGFYFISKLTPYLLWQFYILRLTSTLFYFATVFVVWRILLLFIKRREVASSILLFFSLNPLVIKMGIGVNPDIGLTFFSLAFLYALLTVSLKKIQTKNIVNLAVLSAVTTLTKISGVFTNAAFTFNLLFVRGITKKTIKELVIFQGIFFALVMPWLLFIYHRYNTFFPEPFSRSCAYVSDGPLINKLLLIPLSFRHTVMHYTGFMGQAWPHPFDWFFVGYVLLFVPLAVVGAVIVWREKEALYKSLIFYTVPLFLFLSVISGIHRFELFDCDVQGRYMMPVFFTLCFFVYIAIRYILRSEERAALVLRAFAIFHYLFILFTVLLLRYYV